MVIMSANVRVSENAMSVRGFFISKKGKIRKSIDVNDRLICKYLCNTRKEKERR